MNDYTNRFGEVIAHLVAPEMHNKFNVYGYHYGKASTEVIFEGKDGKRLAEVDVLLENEDYVLAIEVKTKPKNDDVVEHLERLEKVRIYADGVKYRRKIIGAIAGAVMPDSVRNSAIVTGFWVIEPAGDTMRIAPSPAGFKPREW